MYLRPQNQYQGYNNYPGWYSGITSVFCPTPTIDFVPPLE